VIDDHVTNRCFRYVPRNRIVYGTFKKEEDSEEDRFFPRVDIQVHTAMEPSRTSSSFGSANVGVESKRAIKKGDWEDKGWREQSSKLLDKEEVESENEGSNSEI
jgi:hypothetical protein